MIKEIEDEIVKKEQLQIKRDEMNEIKNEIKILETKLKSIREEYDEIDID